MLHVDDVTVRYDSHVALDHVDLRVGEGETLAVLGPSGCGKTTLLRAIAGLQPLAEGRVSWNGEDLRGVPPHERRFGLMFQEYALFPHRDVRGNVEFGLRMAHVERGERTRRVGEVLELVGLGALAQRDVATLSGGEQQRVALARALAVQPRLLMLDEPLGALDRSWRTHLLDEVRTLLERLQLPAVYVTHDHDEAFAIAARVAVMRDGRVVQCDTPERIWQRPADAWTAAFLGFGPTAVCAVRDGMIDSPWGELCAGGKATAAQAVVVLRPDALRFDDDGPLAGVVTRVRFSAAGVAATVVPDGGEPFTVRTTAARAIERGARVRCRVDPEAVLVYDHPAD